MESKYDKIDMNHYRKINHGEDYLTVGYDDNFIWLQDELETYVQLVKKSCNSVLIARKLKRPLCEVLYLETYIKHSKQIHDKQPLRLWLLKQLKGEK